MKALETDLGCRLFDRMSKKVLLTHAGEQLLQHADKILLEMSAARESITQLGKWGRGRLRVGASTTACQYILPEVLSDFKKSYPEAMIAVEPGDTREAIRDAIQDTKNFQGATGTISINADRNPDKPVVIVQIKNKRYTYVATMNEKPGAGSAPTPGTPAPTK